METNYQDKLHRLEKYFMDSGIASSIEEAKRMMQKFQLLFTIEKPEKSENQIALLTGVALATRAFLGGVQVCGDLDVDLKVRFPLGKTLREAVKCIGGEVTDNIDAETPTISITDTPIPKNKNFHIRTAFSGWRGGILPINNDIVLSESATIPLAPMLSVALAVNEAFMYVSETSGEAGLRQSGMSLWNPNPIIDWRKSDDNEISLKFLPSRLWIIGLGHLGQAYLWALGLLPYPKGSDIELVLQDVDVITESTQSTSILSEISMVGKKKTRVLAEWAENLGFKTRIFERLFDKENIRHKDDPTVAFCGIDNAIGRIDLDKVGFEFIIESGIGAGFQDFQEIFVHTLPASRKASEIWNVSNNTADANSQISDKEAYQSLLKEGKLDECGIVTLAGRAVGAPFVGAVAACLAVSECLRQLHGGIINEKIDVDLTCLEYRNTFQNVHDFSSLNPGYVEIDGS